MKLNPSNLHRLLILFPILLIATPLLAGFPSPQGRVNDFAGVLDAGAKSHLLDRIHEVESKTTAEIAVVTVPSLDGMTVEDYANKLFLKWGIGKKKQNNGLLVLVCPPERKVRIEVGYGLEQTINDGLAGSVIRAYFIPAFKKGDFAGGITAGVDQLAKFIDGTQKAEDWNPPDMGAPDTAMDLGTKIGITAFVSLFIWIGMILLGYGLGAKGSFFILFGLFFGGIPSLIVLIPDLAGWPRVLIPCEVAAGLVLGLFLGLKYPKALNEKSGKGGRGGGGSSGGGFSSSSSSDSSSSDDSFGGGSSGGGGASGSW
jgi:uncharacterized protein